MSGRRWWWLPLCAHRKKHEWLVLVLLSLYMVLCLYSLHSSSTLPLSKINSNNNLRKEWMLMVGIPNDTSTGQNATFSATRDTDWWTILQNQYLALPGVGSGTSPKRKTASLPLLPSWPDERGQRFPSVSERVKIYMGHWFLPPCSDVMGDAENRTSSGHVYFHYNTVNDSVVLQTRRIDPTQLHHHHHTATIGTSTNQSSPSRTTTLFVRVLVTDAASRQPFFAKQEVFDHCNETFAQDKRIRHECLDVHSSIPRDFLWNKEPTSNGSSLQHSPPILLRFGDRSQLEPFPIFQKWRPSLSPMERTKLTNGSCTPVFSQALPPIVWLLNSKRHYRFIHSVPDADTLWQHKKNQALFRGGLTGYLSPAVLAQRNTSSRTNATLEINGTDELRKCLLYTRCRLVLSYANSSLVDAKLTGTFRRLSSTVVNGTNLIGPSMSLEEQLQYKAIIFMEGNGTFVYDRIPPMVSSIYLPPSPGICLCHAYLYFTNNPT